MTQPLRCCGDCQHYKRVDLRAFLNDPDCVYMLCTWEPEQPFWLPPPYLAGPSVNLAAAREPGDGADCRAWIPR